jgi:nucleoside-diphosphate-sugar epimerase
MKVAVTGATGYIGKALLAAIAKKGCKSLALSRRPTLWADEWCEYDLFSHELSLPDDVDCVIHLAMNFEINSSSEQEKEIRSATILAEATQKVGAKFIYISSQTASLNAPTMYGKTKWEIEQVVIAHGGIVVRPGLVYGGKAAGLYYQLQSLVRRFPILPCFFPAPKVQPIHVDDLCEAILRLNQLTTTRSLFSLAATSPVSFSEFLSLIATQRYHKIYLPFFIPRLIVDVSKKILPKNPTLIRLNSLFSLPVMNTADDLEELQLTLRELSSGLHPSGSNRRRLLLEESKVLFFYINGRRESCFSFRSYVKVIESLRNSEAIGFSMLTISSPWLLGLIDKNPRMKDLDWYSEFCWRLDAATYLCEASISGARRFLRLGRTNSAIHSFLICSRAVINEIFFRLLRPLAYCFKRLFIKAR